MNFNFECVVKISHKTMLIRLKLRSNEFSRGRPEREMCKQKLISWSIKHHWLAHFVLCSFLKSTFFYAILPFSPFHWCVLWEFNTTRSETRRKRRGKIKFQHILCQELVVQWNWFNFDVVFMQILNSFESVYFTFPTVRSELCSKNVCNKS